MTSALSLPTYPAIIPAATYIRPEILATYENIYDVPYQLQGLDTTMLYIDSTGELFHLNGSQAGREGVRLGLQMSGEHTLPFEQVVTESAYQMGATIERVNYLMRKISFRVVIGNVGMANIAYRMCEDRWWRGQDEVNGGWFGVYTRYSGWRWIPVWPEKTSDTMQKGDPVMYQNNMSIWDIHWISPVPYYSKPAVTSKPWIAANAGPPDGRGFYHGTLALPNRGDLGSYVNYAITNGAGTNIVQDNNSSNYVTLPEIYPKDGQVLVNTDPTQRTLIAQNDPIDNEFYSILSAGGLLNYLLTATGLQAQSEALWLRGYVRFVNVTPPQTVTHYHVASSNPNAKIVAQLGQRYKRSR